MKIIKRILCVSVIASALTAPLFCEDSLKPKMVKIPGQHYEMMTTEVTQGLYKSVMGENPSYFRNDNEELGNKQKNNLPENTKNNPVENVSWYDAIYFCNLLSKREGLEPVYAVDDETDVEKWDYTPHNRKEIDGEITRNENADGYRLSTVEEWWYAAIGGQIFTYSGSNDIGEVAWYDGNSGNTTHPVAQKKANCYGLYDMTGNVEEWCWDVAYFRGYRYNCGGSWSDHDGYCEVDYRTSDNASSRTRYLGFRLVRTIK